MDFQEIETQEPTRSTDHQIKKELDAMYNEMRDPEAHERAALKDNLKRNVKRNTQRVGL